MSMYSRLAMCVVLLVALSGCAQADAESAGGLEPFAAAPGFKGATTILGQHIQYPKTDDPIIISRILDFAPGEDTGWHKHPVPNYTQVIEGTLTIDFEDRKSMEFPAGTGLIDAMDVWHNGKNAGDVPLKVVVVILGEKGKQNLIRR